VGGQIGRGVSVIVAFRLKAEATAPRISPGA